MRRISILILALGALALAGCGQKAEGGGPLDANRPPSPPPPATGGMSAPPPAAAPATNGG